MYDPVLRGLRTYEMLEVTFRGRGKRARSVEGDKMVRCRILMNWLELGKQLMPSVISWVINHNILLSMSTVVWTR